jgi:hypothetical protein
MRKRFYLFLFVALLSINKLHAQSNWVTFTKATPEAPEITLLQSNTSAVIFRAQTSGMFSEDINENGTMYQRINLPKQSAKNNEGLPEIPIIRKLIAIPECSDITLTVNTNSPLGIVSNYVELSS